MSISSRHTFPRRMQEVHPSAAAEPASTMASEIIVEVVQIGIGPDSICGHPTCSQIPMYRYCVIYRVASYVFDALSAIVPTSIVVASLVGCEFFLLLHFVKQWTACSVWHKSGIYDFSLHYSSNNRWSSLTI